MAIPSNASEPESPDDEEIIEPGFDYLGFWDQYRQIILLAGGVVLLGLVGFGIYEYMATQRSNAAATALAQAASDTDYQQVIQKYPGTIAAGDAALFQAEKLRAGKKYDESIQVLQTFLSKNPAHPLVSGAELAIAEALEAEGKLDEALAGYQEVAAKYPDSYSAPLAVLAQANILTKQGKTEDARRMYENFVAQFPDSLFAQEAMTEMHMLPPAPGGPSVPSTSNAAPAAPASPAPLLPAVPGASPN